MVLLREVKMSKFMHKWKYGFANSNKSTVIVYVFIVYLLSRDQKGVCLPMGVPNQTYNCPQEYTLRRCDKI